MKRKFVIISLIVIVLLGIVFFAINSKNKSIPVKKINLEQKIVLRTVNASGIVKSKNEADLAFSGIGKLTHLSVEKNEQVNKGQLVAAVDNSSDSSTAKALKDTRDIAIRDKDLFVQLYSTNKNAAGGSDEYEIQLRRYDENISKAENAYNAQLSNVRDAYLYAPFNGTIIDVFKEAGETVVSGEKVVKVADLNNLIFQVDLDQEDFGFLQQGQKVDIKLDAYEKETFYGVVDELPSYADPNNNNNFSVDIKIVGDNKDKVLLGMTGDGYIILSTTEKEVSSLTYDDVNYDEDNKPYLFLLDGERVKKTPVEIGLQGDIYTEIKTPIEKTIISSYDEKIKLLDGEKVKLKN